MTLILERTRKANGQLVPAGCSDAWTLSAEGCRPGIGKTRIEAKGSFFGANLDKFGVTSIRDIDPENPTPAITWASYNR